MNRDQNVSSTNESVVLGDISSVHVCLETIIGKRIDYKDLSTVKYDFVISDAVIDLSFWRRMWRDGKV